CGGLIEEGFRDQSPHTKHLPISTPRKMVGLSRFELLTPRLSSVCSNQLSYRPSFSTRNTPFYRNDLRHSLGAPFKPVLHEIIKEPNRPFFTDAAKAFRRIPGIGPILSKLDRRAYDNKPSYYVPDRSSDSVRLRTALKNRAGFGET